MIVVANDDGKKMVELEEAELFLAEYAHVAGVELTFVGGGERPNFVCEKRGRRYGLELVKAMQDPVRRRMTAKRIFVACPIGDEASDERKRSDRLLKYVIAPVVQDVMSTNPDDVLLRADKIAAPGRITKQVITEIANCDVMIADVVDKPSLS